MRPLELRITGLRSYRTDTTVDFTDLNLLAIIGATGSGKSSLLEAITYALYGNATWGGKSTKALIADGAISMTVSLNFLADGERWLITRKASRGAYPPSTQELQCLSDAERPKIDGSTDVKARIVELIGLDYEGFKSCVLLPQGRFDQLLKATDADRVGILKGILGLEALKTTRVRAQELGEVASDRLEELRKARAAFMQNPRATHDTAAATIATLKPRVEALGQLEQRVQTLLEEVRGYQADSNAAAQAAARLAERVDTELLDRLRVLERLEAELTAIREDAVAAAAAAEREALAARTAVADAKRDGRNAAAITGIRGTIDAATAELGGIAEARTQLAGKRAELATDRTTLAESIEQVATLAREHGQAAEAEQQAETAASRARADAAALIARIEALTTARTTLASSETKLQDLLTRSELAHQQSQEALAYQRQAEEALKQAKSALDDADRANAALRAALGCEPGDNCPVCSQPLLPTFQIPEASADFAALQQAFEDAQDAERNALTALASRRAADAQASAEVANATTARDQAKAAWTLVAASPLPGDLSPDTVTADTATIAALNNPAEQAERQCKVARLASKKASDAHTAAAAAVKATEHALVRRAQDLASETEGIDRREQSMRSRLRLLPAWVEVPPAAELGDLAACEARLAAALVNAEALEELAATTAAAARGRHDQLEAIKERMQTELSAPAMGERNALRNMSAEADRHRAHQLPAAPPAAPSVSQLLVWGEQVVAGADETLRALQDTAGREAAKAQAIKAEGVALLKGAGFETSEELRREVIDAAGELKYGTSEHQRAAAQLEPGAKLDDLVSRAEQLRGGLRELAFQLGDGKFVGFVVEQRQQALLALASGIVGEVTGGRYGFTRDFDIVDRQTGASRTPETLSGGETFLVSLALALGLVELADRSGGRLQALFLDEGFGSLDPDALDQALSALERRAEAGRLIAMISHVPAIAERIEQVLQVTKTPNGSEVRLLTEDERATLLLDDATQQAAAAA